MLKTTQNVNSTAEATPAATAPQAAPTPSVDPSFAASNVDRNMSAGPVPQDMSSTVYQNLHQQDSLHQPKTDIGAAVPGHMTMSRMVQRMHQSVALSPEGTTYFDKIKEAFTAPNLPADLPVTVNQLATPPGAMALTCRGNVVILVPTEPLHNLGADIPRTVVTNRAVQCYRTTVADNNRLLQFLIIPPLDYPKVQAMITSIQNTFYAHIHPEFTNMNIDSLSDDYYVVNTNTADVEAYYKSAYPHTTMPRCDYGFVLSIQPKERYYAQFYGNQRPLGYFEQGNTELVPVAAVTAFTDVWRTHETHMGIAKFGASVRISNILSAIPTFRMTVLLLPMAADVFIRAGLWKQQFAYYGTDEPNLGNLWRDSATNNFHRVTTPDMKDRIIEQFLGAPGLVLDVQEGTYRIPGIERYANNKEVAMKAILDDYAGFCKAPLVPNLRVSEFFSHEYTGIINKNGNPVDSRWADYLTTMVHWSTDASTVAHLLERSYDPKTRAELIRKFYPSLEVLYSNFLTSVDLPFLLQITQSIAPRMKLSQNHALGASNLIDMSFITRNGQAFQQSHLGGGGFAYGGGAHNTGGNPYSNIGIY